MPESFEEKKEAYLEKIGDEYRPVQKEWWDVPSPIYQLTSSYQMEAGLRLDKEGAVLFKIEKREWPMYLVLAITAVVILYMLTEKQSILAMVVTALVCLLLILPSLLDNRARITVNAEGIWLHKEKFNAAWSRVVATYIRNQPGERDSYSLVVHFYDETTDSFREVQTSLEHVAPPQEVANAIEAFKNARS